MLEQGVVMGKNGEGAGKVAILKGLVGVSLIKMRLKQT